MRKFFALYIYRAKKKTRKSIKISLTRTFFLYKKGDLTLKGIVSGLQRYSVIHNTGRPIYVPVYERCSWVTDEMVNEIMNQVPEEE